jgi:DNA-binding beta-propeller fold protein YncE
MRTPLGLACALVLAGCQATGGRMRTLAPLADEGEVFVYVEPFTANAGRLSFTAGAISAERAEGPPVPLELTLPQVRGSDMNRQRLLAWGRLTPGDYPALLLTLGPATLSGEEDGGTSDLLVSAEPVRISVPLRVARGQAVVLTLALQFSGSVQQGFAFTPTFTAAVTTPGVPQLACYASNRALANLSVFDRHDHRALAAIPVGREPEGVAVDGGRQRIYVALSGEDQVQVLDLLTGTELNRVILRAGDHPRELRLTDDGRQLVVANTGSNTVAFIDPGVGLEVARTVVGVEPWALLFDRAVRRVFVVNRRSNSISIVDLASKALVATLGTDAQPMRAQIDRAGSRLYVAQAGSPYLNVYALPALTLQTRVFVGLGAVALKLDSHTDLVYVGGVDETVQVFDPASLIPIARIELPGRAEYLAIDDVENTLVALIAGRREVAFANLSSRRVLGVVDVGSDPVFVAFVGERN